MKKEVSSHHERFADDAYRVYWQMVQDLAITKPEMSAWEISQRARDVAMAAADETWQRSET